jgi:hypothetical protein
VVCWFVGLVAFGFELEGAIVDVEVFAKAVEDFGLGSFGVSNSARRASRISCLTSTGMRIVRQNRSTATSTEALALLARAI